MSSLTLQQKYTRNVRIFTLLEIAETAAFISGNWIFFWLRIMTYGQLGLLDASMFALGMFMEIPTGAIADMVGKKWTLFLAMLSLGVGFIIMGYSNSLEVLAFGFIFAQIGWAFYSGASEALAYDSLKALGREDDFDRIYSRVGVYATVSLMSAALIGGWMYTIDARLPHVAWGLTFMGAAIIALWIVEPPAETDTQFSIRRYFQQLGAGFKQLAQPALRPYLASILVIRGAGYMFTMGLIQPSMAIGFGFMATEQAVVNTLLYLGSGLGTAWIPRLRRHIGDTRSLTLNGLILGLGYMSAFFPLGWVGFFGMLAVRAGVGMISPLSSVILNREIPSESRATTLSTVAFFTRMPYVVTGVIAGTMAQNGQFGSFMLVVGTVIVGVVIASQIIFRTRASYQLSEKTV